MAKKFPLGCSRAHKLLPKFSSTIPILSLLLFCALLTLHPQQGAHAAAEEIITVQLRGKLDTQKHGQPFALQLRHGEFSLRQVVGEVLRDGSLRILPAPDQYTPHPVATIDVGENHPPSLVPNNAVLIFGCRHRSMEKAKSVEVELTTAENGRLVADLRTVENMPGSTAYPAPLYRSTVEVGREFRGNIAYLYEAAPASAPTRNLYDSTEDEDDDEGEESPEPKSTTSSTSQPSELMFKLSQRMRLTASPTLEFVDKEKYVPTEDPASAHYVLVYEKLAGHLADDDKFLRPLSLTEILALCDGGTKFEVVMLKAYDGKVPLVDDGGSIRIHFHVYLHNREGQKFALQLRNHDDHILRSEVGFIRNGRLGFPSSGPCLDDQESQMALRVGLDPPPQLLPNKAVFHFPKETIYKEKEKEEKKNKEEEGVWWEIELKTRSKKNKTKKGLNLVGEVTRELEKKVPTWGTYKGFKGPYRSVAEIEGADLRGRQAYLYKAEKENNFAPIERMRLIDNTVGFVVAKGKFMPMHDVEENGKDQESSLVRFVVIYEKSGEESLETGNFWRTMNMGEIVEHHRSGATSSGYPYGVVMFKEFGPGLPPDEAGEVTFHLAGGLNLANGQKFGVQLRHKPFLLLQTVGTVKGEQYFDREGFPWVSVSAKMNTGENYPPTLVPDEAHLIFPRTGKDAAIYKSLDLVEYWPDKRKAIPLAGFTTTGESPKFEPTKRIQITISPADILEDKEQLVIMHHGEESTTYPSEIVPLYRSPVDVGEAYLGHVAYLYRAEHGSSSTGGATGESPKFEPAERILITRGPVDILDKDKFVIMRHGEESSHPTQVRYALIYEKKVGVIREEELWQTLTMQKILEHRQEEEEKPNYGVVFLKKRQETTCPARGKINLRINGRVNANAGEVFVLNVLHGDALICQTLGKVLPSGAVIFSPDASPQTETVAAVEGVVPDKAELAFFSYFGKLKHKIPVELTFNSEGCEMYGEIPETSPEEKISESSTESFYRSEVAMEEPYIGGAAYLYKAEYYLRQSEGETKFNRLQRFVLTSEKLLFVAREKYVPIRDDGEEKVWMALVYEKHKGLITSGTDSQWQTLTMGDILKHKEDRENFGVVLLTEYTSRGPAGLTVAPSSPAGDVMIRFDGHFKTDNHRSGTVVVKLYESDRRFCTYQTLGHVFSSGKLSITNENVAVVRVDEHCPPEYMPHKAVLYHNGKSVQKCLLNASNDKKLVCYFGDSVELGSARRGAYYTNIMPTIMNDRYAGHEAYLFAVDKPIPASGLFSSQRHYSLIDPFRILHVPMTVVLQTQVVPFEKADLDKQYKYDRRGRIIKTIPPAKVQLVLLYKKVKKAGDVPAKVKKEAREAYLQEQKKLFDLLDSTIPTSEKPKPQRLTGAQLKELSEEAKKHIATILFKLDPRVEASSQNDVGRGGGRHEGS